MQEFASILFSEVLKILILLVPVLVSVAMIVWLDRRVWAFVQKRRGPNVVGPFGLLQSLADALKYIFKEIIIPASSNKVIFILAPIITMTLALISWAVIQITLYELEGIIISLKIYFKASARDCSKPNGPTTFGPLLFCTKAQTRLSNHTIIATDTKTGTSNIKIFKTSEKRIEANSGIIPRFLFF